MSADQDQARITRANQLTATARTAWLTYLALIVFLGVTALGVADEDFFGLDSKTTLPLVDIGVPTRVFFSLAPIFASASYSYLHLYLIRLFVALGSVPARFDGTRIGEVLTPWIVSDSILKVRQLARKDGCVAPTPLDRLLLVFNLSSVWLAGLVIVGWLWWEAMTARDPFIASVALFGLISSIGIGLISFTTLWHEMSGRPRSTSLIFRSTATVLLVVAFGTGLHVSHERTNGPLDKLAEVDLGNARLSSGAGEWVGHTRAREVFFGDWCENVFSECSEAAKRSDAFRRAWKSKRDFDVSILRKSQLKGLNLSGVLFNQAFLPGLDLEDTALTETMFGGAIVEQSDFSRAVLKGADFTGAEASQTKFHDAELSGASFVQAQLLGADFTYAHMRGVNLDRSNLSAAQFGFAYLAGIPTNQIINRARNTIDRFSFTSRQSRQPALEVNITGTSFRNAAIRFYDLSAARFDGQTNIRDAFLDATVSLPEGLVDPNDIPCHWLKRPANNDEEFFGRWRGMVEARGGGAFRPTWPSIAPPGWESVPAIRSDRC